MIETVVDSIRMNLVTKSRVVFLRELSGDRILPIWIGEFEATGIAIELDGTSSKRPLPWDLMKALVAELNGTIERVIVSELTDDTFFARIVIDLGGRSIELDARSSDAIALAVRARCPILVEDLVMERAGHSLEADLDGDDEAIDASEASSVTSSPEDDRLGIFREFINSLDAEDRGDLEKRRGN